MPQERRLLDTDYLALTVYGEARGESIEGQIAVANVIIHRFNTGKWSSIRDVCLAPKQFSCWNKTDPNYPALKALTETEGWSNEQPFKQLIWISRGIIENRLIDNVNGNVNYMGNVLFNSGHRPIWAAHPKNIMVIGHHTFFTA